MHRSLDMRYQGQGYELEVPVGAGELAADAISRAARRFHALHKRTYGFAKLEDTMETVNARVTAVGVLTKPKLRRETMRGTDASSARKGTRSVFLRGENHETSVYDRAKLDPGASIEGPAVIEQKDSTVLLFPGQKAHVDAFRNIVIRIKDES